eukprot:scaffold105625_cov19-Tisochrysis_lutea.AAC.1
MPEHPGRMIARTKSGRHRPREDACSCVGGDAARHGSVKCLQSPSSPFVLADGGARQAAQTCSDLAGQAGGNRVWGTWKCHKSWLLPCEPLHGTLATD